MVAFAAVAVLGFGMAPAFAASNTISMSDDAVAGDTEYSYKYSTSACGTSSTTATTEIWVSESDPNDAVQADWSVNCGVVFDDIDVTVYINDSWASSYSTSSSSGSTTFNVDVASGDDVRVDFVINY